tara:strand:- start:251 stop:517 length:267 start_codon:yes stop_codon:yes gene_type:complete
MSKMKDYYMRREYLRYNLVGYLLVGAILMVWSAVGVSMWAILHGSEWGMHFAGNCLYTACYLWLTYLVFLFSETVTNFVLGHFARRDR